MEFLRLRRVPLQERVYTDDAMDVIPLVSAYLFYALDICISNQNITLVFCYVVYALGRVDIAYICLLGSQKASEWS